MSRIAEKHFGDQPANYPERPGYKEPTTSKAAAASINPETLRADVLARLLEVDSTADEIAAHLKQSVLTIRPRVSELRADGRIRKTGLTRKNQSKKSAIVWTAKP